jgi:hypothetical protein
MTYTLGTAARAIGKSKSTLSRDIHNGRLSAIRKENGSFEIDPAELCRVYPPMSPEQAQNHSGERLATHESGSENRALQAENQGLREHLALLKNERDDLRRRLDSESEERRRLTYLLTDARSAPMTAAAPQGGWWTSLFHNKAK